MKENRQYTREERKERINRNLDIAIIIVWLVVLVAVIVRLAVGV